MVFLIAKVLFFFFCYQSVIACMLKHVFSPLFLFNFPVRITNLPTRSDLRAPWGAGACPQIPLVQAWCISRDVHLMCCENTYLKISHPSFLLARTLFTLVLKNVIRSTIVNHPSGWFNNYLPIWTIIFLLRGLFLSFWIILASNTRDLVNWF